MESRKERISHFSMDKMLGKEQEGEGGVEIPDFPG